MQVMTLPRGTCSLCPTACATSNSKVQGSNLSTLRMFTYTRYVSLFSRKCLFFVISLLHFKLFWLLFCFICTSILQSLFKLFVNIVIMSGSITNINEGGVSSHVSIYTFYLNVGYVMIIHIFVFTEKEICVQ